MELFELVLILLLTGAVLTVLAQRIGAPYPALLAIAGAVLALVPSGATATLDPELALALFVAPTLLDAAYDASPRDLKKAWVPVTGLVLVAVALTVAGVAIVARTLVPDMPWAVAIALGAIVAPPDAAAATAVLRTLSPPHRIMVILEGESLLNDASALLIYRVALGAVGGMAFSWWAAGGVLLMTCAGGALLGYGLARLYVALMQPTYDIAVSVVTQFVGTFIVWIVAERLDVSPIITTVVYAVTIARMAPGRLGAEHRRASYAVWEVAVFVLNALAFILIGLQLRGIIGRLDGHAASTAVFAGAVLLTVVLVRFAWVMGFTTFLRTAPLPPTAFRPPFAGSVVVGWCGMRGIVTLAAALALPDGAGPEPEFPYRDLVVTAAFAVVLGTLVIQGLTLAPLMRWLRMTDDGAVGRELETARGAVALAATDALRGTGSPYASALIEEFGQTAAPAGRFDLALHVIALQRSRLLELRRTSVIGDEAFQQVEEELDWAEGHTLRRLRSTGTE
ncbi:MAG: sodium:proton antiporter [Acetobacteraceae bacterium]